MPPAHRAPSSPTRRPQRPMKVGITRPSLPDRNYVLGRKGDEKTVGREKIVQSERKKTHIRRTIMNAFDLLLDQWTQQVKEIFPALHHSQQQSIAFCVQGIIQSGNAVMQRVAEAVWEHS